MKIWIDLTNSPHVNFFRNLIVELSDEHDLILTCRPLANTLELLRLHGFQYEVVGAHYGQNIIKKIFGFFIRIYQLFIFLRNRNIDVSISHSSFYSPLVSRLLGIRSIYLNDNEFAAGNIISFLFANKILIPEFLDKNKIKKQLATEKKIMSYPGVKEGVYLWIYKTGFEKKYPSHSRKTVYIRPEPWNAQYYKGKRNFIDELLIDLKDNYNTTLLPRGDLQKKYYSQEMFTGVFIPDKSLSLDEIMETCDLFIGAGGTMTREAAVLGIPTISIYQDELLDVDLYLIKKGFMIHKKDLTAEFVTEFLDQKSINPPDPELLRKGREAYELIIRTLTGNS